VVVLGCTALAFTAWFAVDALRRGAHAVWFLVLLVPFGGPLLYVMAVRLREAEGPAAGAAEPSDEPTLEQIASEVERSPSFNNRMRMGWALVEHAQPTRARCYFERALSTHPGDKDALYGLGISQLEQGAAAEAVETLSRLVERRFAYGDFDAAMALCEAHIGAGQDDRAAELLEAVAQASGRLEHQVALARHHVRLSKRTEAQDVLRGALARFDALPDFMRQRNGAAATEARRLLRMLQS